MIYLKEANLADIEKEYLFVREIPLDENGFTNPYHGISRSEFDAALSQMLAWAKGEQLPEGFVAQTYLFLWDDDLIVGQFRVRHVLNDALRHGAGHIGYFIHKDHRKKGYATRGLRLTLDWARDRNCEKEFYLRVNKNNPASLRAMQKNGGRIVAEDEEKYYVRIPK